MNRIFTCVCLLVLPWISSAQNANYNSLGGPAGGSVGDIIADNSGNLLAVISGTGIYRSTNGGTSWALSNTGITDYYINDLEKDPVSGKIYALAYSTLFTSVDGGQTWVSTASVGFTGGFRIKKTTSYLFIVANDNGAGSNNLYRSSDDGTTWGQAGVFTGYPINVETNSIGDVFIGTTAFGVYMTTNGLDLGQVNGTGGTALTDLNIVSMAVSGTNLFALAGSAPFLSTDNGNTWSSAKGNNTDVNYYGSTIAADPFSATVYIFNDNSLSAKKTTNNGSTWVTTGLTNPVPAGQYFNTPAIYFAASATFYVSVTGLGIEKTTNTGSTWSLVASGMTAFYPSDFAITSTGKLVYARGYTGLYISIDDGVSWNLLASGNTQRNIQGFLVQGTTIYAYGYGIIKSTDGGTTWTVVNVSTSLNSLISDGTNFYSNDGTNLLKSTTGASFTTQTVTGTPSGGFSIQDTKADASGNVYWLLTDYGNGYAIELYKINPSTGAATQITNVPAGGLVDIDYYNGKLYALLGNNQIAITSNAGSTWTTKSTSAFYGTLKVINDQVLFILNSNSYISTDGGNSWVNQGSFGENRNVRTASISATNYSYVAITNGPVFKSTKPVVPPVAPSGLVSTGFVNTQVDLAFTDNSNNENYFIVEQSLDNVVFDSVAAAQRDDSYPQTRVDVSVGTNGSTQYYFRVRAASNTAGKSAYSNTISVTTLSNACTPSSTPIPNNHSWTANSGGSNVLHVNIQGTGGTYTVSDLNAGACLSVSGSDISSQFYESCGQTSVIDLGTFLQNGNGTWNSGTKTITLKWQSDDYYPACSGVTTFVQDMTDPPPADVSALNAYPISSTNVLLRWVNSAFEQQYIIQRSTTDSAHFTELARVAYPNTAYNDLTVTGGTTYYYKVRAANGTPDGNGHYNTLSPGFSPGAKVTLLTNPLFEPIINSPFVSYVGTTGGTWGDIDGDGFDDLILPTVGDTLGNLIPPLIFKGKGNGQFSKIVIPELDSGSYRNVNVIDVDNDGLNDIFLRKADNTNDLLFIKQTSGSYQRISMPSGSGSRAMSAWADYDNDGYLDLFVTTDDGGLTPSRLYKNNGNKTFTKITSGDMVNDLIPVSLDAEWADYDNDGDQDLFRPASGGCKLYQNNGNGTFTRVVGSVFDSFTSAQRTASWGDYDNDGDLDLFVGSTSGASGLFRNNGNGTFTQITTSADITALSGIFGSGWGDVDNDGDLDLLVTSSIQSQLLYNNSGIFTKYATVELFNAPGLSKLYGVPFYDVDQDGFLDFYNGGFSAVGVPNIVYKNKTAHSASTNWIEIRLVGTTSNKSAIGARVKLTAGGKTQMREVQSHSSHGSEGSLIVHFGIGSATTITSIVVDWPNSIPNQTLLNPAINQILTITEDVTGPAVSTLLPANNATGVMENTNLDITFTDISPIVAVAGKNIKIFDSSAPGTPVQTSLVSTMTQQTNKFILTLTSNLTFLKTYFVTVDSGAFADIYGNNSASIKQGAWTFTVRDQPDTQPPAITGFTADATWTEGTTPRTYNITATDDKHVDSVNLYYRGVTSKPFTEVNAVLNGGTGKYDVTMQGTYFDAMGVEFYLEAVDGSHNVTRLPATAGTYFLTRILFNTSSDTHPGINLSAGGQVGDYKLFSIPYDLTSNLISTIFDPLGSADNTKWRLINYSNANKNWALYPADFSSIIRGTGYLINSVTASTISFGDATTPNYSRSNLFLMNLKSGWNQIGNPYTVPVSWEQVIAFNSQVAAGVIKSVKYFTSAGYEPGDQLDPQSGGFVFVTNDVSNVMIPFLGMSTGGRRESETPSAQLDQPQWVTPLKLVQGSLENRFSGVGMAPAASPSMDQFDDVTPPRFMEFLEVNFPHPEYFVKNFALDVVPTQNAYTWEFKVNSNQQGPAMLSWDNSAFGSNTKELYLFDIAQQKPIDMRALNQYTFNPQESSAFKVYFGENLEETIKPDRIMLGTAYPNPTTGVTTIPFTLPDQTSPFRVKLEVYDIMGTRVSTLVDGEFSNGFYQTQWNPGILNLAEGVYIYRMVVAGGASGSTMLSGKVILKK